jgi:hypothetical protein
MAIAVYDPILFGDTSGDLGLRSRAAGQNMPPHLPNLGDMQALIGDNGTLRGRARRGLGLPARPGPHRAERLRLHAIRRFRRSCLYSDDSASITFGVRQNILLVGVHELAAADFTLA